MEFIITKPISRGRFKGREEEIYDLYFNQNKTIRQVAAILECDMSFIRKFFKNNNLICRPFLRINKNIADNEEQIKSLYIEGESTTDIAKIYNVTASTILKVLRRHNITIRSPKEARNTKKVQEKDKNRCKNIPNEIVNSIVKLYSEGYGAKRLAKQYKVDSCIIFRVLEERNIPIRRGIGVQTAMTKKLANDSIIKRYGSWKKYREWQIDKFEEKYGVRNAMHVEEFFNKCQESGCRFKEDVLNGVNIKYQGYELFAIKKLLSEGYLMDDIKIGRNMVPIFRYMFNGKNRVYYPDIYIPKENKIIEVKSVYMYEKFKDKNLAKRDAVIAQNYEFDFLIIS